VLTHGFTLAETPQDVEVGRQYRRAAKGHRAIGADILRLWVCATELCRRPAHRPEILKNTIETYRKLRNSIRWMLGTLHHFKPEDAVAPADMPEWNG